MEDPNLDEIELTPEQEAELGFTMTDYRDYRVFLPVVAKTVVYKLARDLSKTTVFPIDPGI